MHVNVRQAVLSLEAALEEDYPGEWLDTTALRIVLDELARYRTSRINGTLRVRNEWHTLGDGTEVQFIYAQDDEWHASFPVFTDLTPDEVEVKFLASKLEGRP